MGQVGKDLTDHPVPNPFHGQDATHQVRLARASSNLALTPQGWGSHSLSGQSASQLTRKEAGPPGKESQKDALILEVNESTEEGSKINAQQIYKKKRSKLGENALIF